MTKRRLAVGLVLLVLLAGCGGSGGGGDDPEREVEILNEEALETGVDHVEPAEVRADITDEDSLEEATLTYTVYNRSGALAPEDDPLLDADPEGALPMEKDGENYAAEVPGVPAGYTVEYDVEADYGDETVVSSGSYTASYVESVDGPLDGEEVDSVTSPVRASLWTDEGIERVEVEYTRTLEDGDVTDSDSSTLLGAEPLEREGHVRNLKPGEQQSEVTIEYRIRVVYGPEERSHVTENRTYSYVDDSPSLLYVGVAFDESDPDVTTDDIDAKAEKVNEYYLRESRGKAAWRHELLRADDENEYFVLPGDPVDYLEPVEETSRTRTDRTGNTTVTETRTEYEYDRMKIFCTAREHVDAESDVEYGDYQAVVFSHPRIDGSNYRVTWTTENETMVLPDGREVEGNGEEYVVRQDDQRPPAWAFKGLLGRAGETTYCEGFQRYPDIGTRFSVTPADRPYGTFAHELGHALYGWEDYYNTDDSAEGITGRYALMGSGTSNDDAPSQVMAYHKIEEGWTDYETIESGDLDDGESKTVFVPYAADTETVDPGHRAVEYEDTELSIDLFDAYLFEARDPVREELPHQNGRTTPDAGLLAFTVDDTYLGGDKVNLVQSAEVESTTRWPSDPTIRTEDYDSTIHDPDLGVTFGVDPSPRAPEDGLLLNVTKTSTSDVQGVNVFTRIDCANVTSDHWCSHHTDGSMPENATPLTVGLYAYTDEGVVGVHPNGTVVDEVEGAEVVSAGAIRKVYLPADVDAKFVVDTSEIPDGAEATVTSQTVTRDEEGERIASDISNETVAGNDTSETELARLTVSDDAWHAGQLRTLDDNATTIAVRNSGIADLENVTVSTDSDLLLVNETELGTMEDTERNELELEVVVPGGTPVGEYTANLTITGDGTTGERTVTIPVTVDVMPTVRWSTDVEDATGSIANDSETTLELTVENDESSNVPLRDLSSTVSGNVTKFDVDGPRFVETVEPGETVTLETTAAVPDGGIEEGTYDGTIALDPLVHYGQYFEYPIDVPDEYAAPSPTGEEIDASVTAHGPTVDSDAAFHPDEQVAMRRGAATQRVRVDPTDAEVAVPLDGLSVRASIPEGWEFNGEDPQRQTKVWILEEAGAASDGSDGRRVQLDETDYEVAVTDDEIVLTISDLPNTSYGEHMTPSNALEFEFKINKERAADHEYGSTVDVESRSPVDVFRFQRPAAEIDAFDPRPGAPPADVVDDRPRVPRDGIAMTDDPDAIGTNATLVAQELYRIDDAAESDYWMRFELEAEATDAVRTVMLPVERTDDGIRLLPSDAGADGEIVLDGVATRSVQGSISSGLRNGEDVRLLLEADGDATDVEVLEPTNETSGSFALRSGDGEVTIEVGAETRTAGDDTVEVHIPVVVGEDVFDPSANAPASDEGDND